MPAVQHMLFNKLAVLTPSLIATEERYNFAADSLLSLRRHLTDKHVTQIVVHDHPAIDRLVPKLLKKFFSRLRWDSKARALYESHDFIWVNGNGQGSARAMLEAVNVAISQGKTYGFIHLDDQVYADGFGELLGLGLQALEDHTGLLWTRFSGYPVIFDKKQFITADTNDQVIFADVRLSPMRKPQYTLWMSPLNEEANKGTYWPIAMWFCIYRLSFLKTLLEWALETNTKHLAHVELFYKSKGGYKKLMEAYPEGSFGYINMQYGGIEMHRNLNWRTLLSLPNEPVR